jgi:hypothetical protein
MASNTWLNVEPIPEVPAATSAVKKRARDRPVHPRPEIVLHPWKTYFRFVDMAGLAAGSDKVNSTAILVARASLRSCSRFPDLFNSGWVLACSPSIRRQN